MIQKEKVYIKKENKINEHFIKSNQNYQTTNNLSNKQNDFEECKKKIQDLENERQKYLDSLEKKENDIKREMMKKFRFSSIENLKNNLYLFNKEIELLKLEEEKKKQLEIIHSLQNNDIKEFFNNTKKEDIEANNSYSDFNNGYLDILKKRFN